MAHSEAVIDGAKFRVGELALDGEEEEREDMLRRWEMVSCCLLDPGLDGALRKGPGNVSRGISCTDIERSTRPA
jgi:hypothetical protein